MKVQSNSLRVEKYIDRHLKSWPYSWDKVSDPRDRRGRRWKSVGELLDTLLLGFVSGCKSLRHVEALTEDMGACGRKHVSKRVPDTTLSDLIPKLCVKQLRQQLICQVKASWRKKELKPVGLPCGVITIDGKGLGALKHNANGKAQEIHNEDGEVYYLSRMLRAVLSSAESRPCIDQMSIGAKTNEMGNFASFFQGLLDDYGKNNDLFEIVDVDAGMVSKANASLIHNANKAYVMNLKGGQPELLSEAERLLGSLRKAEIETEWERYKGNLIQRRLFRTTEIAGYHEWHHLRQVWRVEQITQFPDGKIEKEQRYYLTSLTSGRLSPLQILLLVRAHWRVENDCFWSLDMQWNEDSAPWCRTGISFEVLSWLRIMAYNLVQKIRRRHLRKKLTNGTKEAPPAWARVFEWIKQAWQLPVALHKKPVHG